MILLIVEGGTPPPPPPPGPPNLQDHTFTTAASFDGIAYTDWPTGNKPSGVQVAPTIVDTDIICGSLSGGEYNLGAYMRLTGYSFGSQQYLGTSQGARVYFRDPLGDNLWHEVANYRYLLLPPVFATHQLQELCVQLGPLGGSMVAGRKLDVKVNVAGTDSAALIQQFTVQPGRFAFIDNVLGSDATGLWDNINFPFRFPQVSTGGSTFSDLCGYKTQQNEFGLNAGDTLVYRAHPGVPWVDQVGYDGRFFRFRLHSGTPPTGNLGSGYIHHTVYPGPILAHAPEQFVFVDPAGGKGFIHGCNSGWGLPNHQAEFTGSISGTTLTITAMTGVGSGGVSKGGYLDTASGVAEGTTILEYLTGTGGTGTYRVSVPQTVSSRSMAIQGYGQYWSASGFKVQMSTSSTTDSGGFNLQTSSTGARIYNNEVGPWPATNSPLSGGVAGNGVGVKAKFNYVHDIACLSGSTNHGIYLDGSNLCAKNCEVAYNRIENITGGSAFQTHNQVAPDQFSNILVHHNWINVSGKYGIECGSSTLSIFSWDNVIIGTALAGIAQDSGETNQSQIHTHNLIYGCCTTGNQPQGLFSNVTTPGAGSVITFAHNTLVLLGSRTGAQQTDGFYVTYSSDGGHVALVQNLYWDPDHAQSWAATVPSLDTHALNADPLFTDVNNLNFTSAIGSPALGACTLAEAQAVTTDLYGIARPVTGTGAPGSTKNDIGPFQGVGT